MSNNADNEHNEHNADDGENGENNIALEQEIAALLRDPSLWEEPGDGLADRVVAGIAAERRVVVPLRPRHRSWPGRLAAAALGAAAAVGVVLVVRSGKDDVQRADARIDIVGTPLAPTVRGTAAITTEASGVRIQFSVPGLPRREGTEFYEAWLKDCAGTALVPIGTFHELGTATGWAGVGLDDFAVITVTREAVAPPKDAAQGSSGEVVVSGSLKECPPA